MFGSWAFTGIFPGGENSFRGRQNLKFMARGLTKMLKIEVELLKVSIFEYVLSFLSSF